MYCYVCRMGILSAKDSGLLCTRYSSHNLHSLALLGVFTITVTRVRYNSIYASLVSSFTLSNQLQVPYDWETIVRARSSKK